MSLRKDPVSWLYPPVEPYKVHAPESVGPA